MLAMRRPSLLLLCLLAASSAGAQSALERPVDDLRERLAACSACHGDAGEGIAGTEYNPHLAGKPDGYLRDQLQAFRDGRRHHAQMNWLLRNIDDAYIDEIARHYAALPARTRPETTAGSIDPATAERARQLVHDGDAAAGIPACSACHGADLTGLAPGIPALVGLPAEYVVAQFGAWRSGVRTAKAPDCMGDIARALDPRDVRIMATWLASQGHAEPRAPAPAGTFLPPRACGTLPHADAATQTNMQPTPETGSRPAPATQAEPTP